MENGEYVNWFARELGLIYCLMEGRLWLKIRLTDRLHINVPGTSSSMWNDDYVVSDNLSSLIYAFYLALIYLAIYTVSPLTCSTLNLSSKSLNFFNWKISSTKLGSSLLENL
jgi:hypothetical protein